MRVVSQISFFMVDSSRIDAVLGETVFKTVEDENAVTANLAVVLVLLGKSRSSSAFMPRRRRGRSIMKCNHSFSLRETETNCDDNREDERQPALA